MPVIFVGMIPQKTRLGLGAEPRNVRTGNPPCAIRVYTSLPDMSAGLFSKRRNRIEEEIKVGMARQKSSPFCKLAATQGRHRGI